MEDCPSGTDDVTDCRFFVPEGQSAMLAMGFIPWFAREYSS
jgi:hypothetical protein